MRTFAGVVLGLALMSIPAVGQAQLNPVVEHYRAYRAALESNDLTTAEAEAEAALVASEARDGDGGRTGVLALNLATVRLRTRDAIGAEPPARRALALAQAGAAGMDVALAELVVARMELATQGQPGADKLAAIFSGAEAGRLPAEEMHQAAAELGTWALAERQYALAQTAWANAGMYAEGSLFGEALGRGRARTAEAAAIILREIGGHAGRTRMDFENARNAYDLLIDAQLTLTPFANAEAPTQELTVGQSVYAEALAWRLALDAKMRADGQRVPEMPTEAQGDADGMSEIGPIDLTRPRCMMQPAVQPGIRYPPSMVRRGGVAAIVLFIRTNESGEVVSSQVAARVGAPEFAEAVERAAPNWRFEAQEASGPNCRMAAAFLQTVRFVLNQ